MPYSHILVTALGILTLLPRFFIQGYSIARGLPGSELLLLVLGISGFSPYIFGLLSARINDAFARSPVNEVFLTDYHQYFEFIKCTVMTVIFLILLYCIIDIHIIKAISAGCIIGLSNQAISLQQSFFAKVGKKSKLLLQQFILLIFSVCLFVIVFFYEQSIIDIMAFTSFLCLIVCFIFECLGDREKKASDINLFLKAITSSLQPFTYFLCSLAFVLCFSIERLVASELSEGGYSEYFFILNAYLVLITLSARIFRFTKDITKLVVLFYGLLVLIIILLKCLNDFFQIHFYYEYVIVCLTYPLYTIFAWRVFQKLREYELYHFAALLFFLILIIKCIFYFLIEAYLSDYDFILLNQLLFFVLSVLLGCVIYFKIRRLPSK